MKFIQYLMISLFLLIWASTSAIAQQEISFPKVGTLGSLVIGIGAGGYTFDTLDDLRTADSSADEDSINSTAITNIYVELYINEAFGIGYRSITASKSTQSVETGESTDGTTPDREVGIRANITTIQLIPLRNESNTLRIGVIGGMGDGEYFVSTKRQGAITAADETEYSVTGKVYLYGAFISFRGEKWGGRIGTYQLITSFDKLDINGQLYEVNGSGKGSMFDLFYYF